MRGYYRKKLNKFLGAAGDEEFIQLLWATNVLQSDSPGPAQKYLLPETIPAGAITPKMTSDFAIYKWEIETLANELMTVPKVKLRKNGVERILLCEHFGVARDCVNWLRRLEDAEYRVQKKREDIFIEMGRIAARQFDWQRGFDNMAQLYRNTFVYGQGSCSAYFEQKNGIALNRFSLVGFILFAGLRKFPFIRHDGSWKELGVTEEEIEKTLALASLPFSEAATLAQLKRSNSLPTADKASILRQSPCLSFGKDNERIRAPLPKLILERVTSGVFYDVVDGGGPIRDDYGKRFEEYCARYLSDMLPSFRWERELSYQKKSNNYNSPDILCSEESKLILAFECKATRMSQQAMFGRDPIADRGYQDITKAVFQLWRFFSHCRRNLTGKTIADNVIGIVLTLDNWLVLASTLRKQVLEDAKVMAKEKDAEIIEIDRKPIVFVAVPELERSLLVATESSFKEAVQKASSQEFGGWRLDTILDDLVENKECPDREYPYADDLTGLLPWWNNAGRNDGT